VACQKVAVVCRPKLARTYSGFTWKGDSERPFNAATPNFFLL
jgi:hypothetical protein